MKKSALSVLAPRQTVSSEVREGPCGTVSGDSQGETDCPTCGTRSNSRYGSYVRSLKDLAA